MSEDDGKTMTMEESLMHRQGFMEAIERQKRAKLESD